MEKRIVERFNQGILAEAAHRYGVAPAAVQRLASAESYIYEYRRGITQHILRIGHSLRRTPDLIAGEVDWINFLAAGGASVSRAVLSAAGNLVEPIDDGFGGHFLATAFVKAPGRPPTVADETPEYFEGYGRAIGRMHRLTRGYEPPDERWRRPQWDDPLMQDMVAFLPPAEAMAARKLAQVTDTLRTLPRERASYGLVHQDAHAGNCFLDDSGTLTFFDFDDCVYTWFAADIAIVLFYASMGRQDPEGFARHFLTAFLQGYQAENHFDPSWLTWFPSFLKLRELELYAIIHRSADVMNLTDPWDIRYMSGRKERIEQDVPFLDVDFGSCTYH